MMDRNHFDNLARVLGSHSSRRRFGGLLVALGIGSSVVAADAKKRRKKKCRGNKKKCGKKCILKTQCCKDADCGAGGSCQGGTCQCPAGKKPCRGTCIPDADCCADGECGAGRFCAGGVCVIGQGTCPAQADHCVDVVHCPLDNSPTNCVCMRTTSGAIRCGANEVLGSDPCETDADCAQLFPQVPGVFCIQGGGSCPIPSVCQAPCACVPDCAGKECGDDGCGGSCGSCPIDQPLCVSGQCVPVPNLP
jgi:hypothetical protein